MSNPTIQLVAYGHQDRFLTAHRDDKFRNYVSFFKRSYSKYLQFAIDARDIPGTGTFNFGQKPVWRIQHDADLAGGMYLHYILPELTAPEGHKVSWVREVGMAMIDEAYIQIGSKDIDGRHTSDTMAIYRELSLESGQETQFRRMIGDVPQLTTPASSTPEYEVYTELPFMNCMFYAYALPLIALQYTEVQIHVRLRKFEELINKTDFAISELGNPTISSGTLTVEYIYLTDLERLKYVNHGHQYLIPYVQTSNSGSITGSSSNTELVFNHPTKYISWGVKLNRYTSGQSFLAYNPSDWEAAKDLATKRFIANTAKRCVDADGTPAEVNDETGVELRVSLDNDETQGTLEMMTGSTGAVAEIWNALGQVVLTDELKRVVLGTPTMLLDNIQYENPIPDRWFSATTGTSSGQVFNGAATGSLIASGTYTDLEDDVDVTVRDHFNYGLHLDRKYNPIDEAVIKVSGQERYEKRSGRFHNEVIPYKFFKVRQPQDGLNTYSFALHPLQYNPSGTLNLSRVENTILMNTYQVPQGETTDFRQDYIGNNGSAQLVVVAQSYNVFRVAGGLGGVLYQN